MRNLYISLVAGLVLLIFFGTASYRVLYDWYLTFHGDPVSCKVLNTAALCSKKNKSVVVLFDEKPYSIHLYGSRCRMDEFPIGQMSCTLYASPNRKRLVPQDNVYPIRSLLYLLLTIFSLIILVVYGKQIRRARKVV